MGWRDRLKSIGCRLHLIRTVARTEAKAPVKISPRVTRLEDLKVAARARPGDRPAHWAQPWAKVFESAGIGSLGKAWDIERLIPMVNACQGMDRSSVRGVLDQILAAEHVTVADLIKDVHSRTEALDAEAKRIAASVQQRTHDRRQQMQAMEDQIARLTQDCARCRAADQDDQQQLQQWTLRKAQYQKDMAAVLGVLVGGAPDSAVRPR